MKGKTCRRKKRGKLYVMRFFDAEWNECALPTIGANPAGIVIDVANWMSAREKVDRENPDLFWCYSTFATTITIQEMGESVEQEKAA
jgi:hypothetical protein